MKAKKKGLLLLLCAATLVASSILGTMAYLTDTETVTNTFTVGSVHLKLDEAKVNADGRPIDANGNVVESASNAKRVTENEYHLLPGHKYTKDPTVTLTKESEDAYVRMMASITYLEEADSLFGIVNKPESIADWLDIDTANWKIYGAPKTSKQTQNEITYITRTYEFRYKVKVLGRDTKDVKLEPLFTKITVPGELKNQDMKKLAGMKIEVVAHAIQADGFNTAEDAWKEFSK